MISTIFLGAGCYWGVEAYFQNVSGVLDTEVGYSGGKTEYPSYEMVCTGTAGHAEVVKVVFDSEIITLNEVLRHFERIHDPTSPNRQGNDIGTQYRSVIFTSTPQDTQTAVIWKEEAGKNYSKPITTEISILDYFYPAEEYHQNYLTKNPTGYCHVDISLAKEPL